MGLFRLFGYGIIAFALVLEVIHAQTKFAPTSICECGALDQTSAQVILECPIHRAPTRYHGMLAMDDEV